MTTITYFVSLCIKLNIACKFYDLQCIYLFFKDSVWGSEVTKTTLLVFKVQTTFCVCFAFGSVIVFKLLPICIAAGVASSVLAPAEHPSCHTFPNTHVLYIYTVNENIKKQCGVTVRTQKIIRTHTLGVTKGVVEKT